MWLCNYCHEELEEEFEMCWKCGTTRNEERPTSFMQQEPDLITDYEEKISNMILTTSSDLKTHTIKKYLGVVCGEAILGANAISDLVAGISDIVGGRSHTYESYLKKGRKIAIKDASLQAAEMKANAIIAISFDYETIRGSMLMVTCSGTAVLVEETEQE